MAGWVGVRVWRLGVYASTTRRYSFSKVGTLILNLFFKLLCVVLAISYKNGNLDEEP
ncbi:hypothetical protein LguiA_030177 [Lonicera macranthoides]